VPALADVQAAVRRALVTGDGDALEPLLLGGSDPRKRLAIHQRHYAISLVTALLERFPATVWLVGSPLVTDAARRFVRQHPPMRPCIAEYGEEFPDFLATQPDATGVPYLREFAHLEWHLSRLSLAVEAPAVSAAAMIQIDPEALVNARVVLQPGVHYLHQEWATDELISLYLADTAPDRFVLDPGDVWLELRGARGELRINRLAHADFVFRAALADGQSFGNAATSALEVDAGFDPGQALFRPLREGLVAAIEAVASPVAHG
jgi:hypothetical protein